MKKTCVLFLVTVLMFLCVSCGKSTKEDTYNNKVGDETENVPFDISYSLDNVVFDKSNSITTNQNGTAQYDDGLVSYCWNTSEWSFDLYNGFPNLTAVFDGFEVSFAILQADEGVADNLHYYAACAAKAYYGLNDIETIGQLFVSSSNNYFTRKGYIAERTGYYESLNKNNESAKNHLSVIYSITNGLNSAVICVDSFAFKEKNEELHQRIFADDSYSELLENYVSTVIESFALAGSDIVNNLSSERFSYADAYSLFKGLYADGLSHAEYLDRVESETELIIREIDKLYDDILDELKQNCLDTVVPVHPDRTYEDYFDTFVLPFIKNYESMRLTVDESYEAYMSLSSTVCYGGTAGSDCTVLWRYVHYRTLRNELIDVKRFLD